MQLTLKTDFKATRAQVKVAKKFAKQGTMNAAHRLGLAVEAVAVTKTAVASGRMKGSAYVDDPEFNEALQAAVCRVGYATSYAIFVEEGFTAHFVPFHVSESLYQEARTRWGWRVPAPGAPVRPRPGWKYLVPPGRKYAVGGVMVSGEAQPSLKPALNKVMNSELPQTILAEELDKAFRKAGAVNR